MAGWEDGWMETVEGCIGSLALEVLRILHRTYPTIIYAELGLRTKEAARIDACPSHGLE